MGEEQNTVILKLANWKHSRIENGMFKNTVKTTINPDQKIRIVYYMGTRPKETIASIKYNIDEQDIVYSTNRLGAIIGKNEITFYATHKPSSDIYLAIKII